jgi:hypothetical protein
MTDRIVKELDVVALLRDLPEYRLVRGQVGTVVDAPSGGHDVLVEFVDATGRTVSLPQIARADLLALSYEAAAAE